MQALCYYRIPLRIVQILSGRIKLNAFYVNYPVGLYKDNNKLFIILKNKLLFCRRQPNNIILLCSGLSGHYGLPEGQSAGGWQQVKNPAFQPPFFLCGINNIMIYHIFYLFLEKNI